MGHWVTNYELFNTKLNIKSMPLLMIRSSTNHSTSNIPIQQFLHLHLYASRSASTQMGDHLQPFPEHVRQSKTRACCYSSKAFHEIYWHFQKKPSNICAQQAQHQQAWEKCTISWICSYTQIDKKCTERAHISYFSFTDWFIQKWQEGK